MWLASDVSTIAMSVTLTIGSQEVVRWAVSKKCNNINLFACFINEVSGFDDTWQSGVIVPLFFTSALQAGGWQLHPLPF